MFIRAVLPWAAATFLLFFAALPATTNAQKFSYCGIEFKPEKLEQADPENYIVQFNGDEVLVKTANIGPWLIRKLVNNPQSVKNIPSAELAAYFESCPSQLEAETEKKLLLQLLSRQDIDKISWEKFFSRSPDNQTLLKENLKTQEWQEIVSSGRSASQYRLIASAVFNIFIRDNRWTFNEIPKLFYFFQPEITKNLKQLLKQLIEEENISEIMKLADMLDGKAQFDSLAKAAKFSADMLNFQHDLIAKKLDISCNKLPRPPDAEVRDLVYPVYRETLILALNFQLDRIAPVKNYSDCLVRIDPAATTLGIFHVTSRLVDQLSASGSLEDLTSDARAVLASLSKMEPSLRAKYIKLLEAELDKALNAADFDVAYQNYLELSQQAASEKEKFRAGLAKLARKRGKENLADQLDSGFFISPLILSPLLAIVFLGSLAALLIYKYRKNKNLLVNFFKTFEKAAKSRSYKDYGELPEEDPSELRSFVRVENARPHNQEMSEYHDTLKKFSLSPNASLKEIKSTYRTLVKYCHPDLNPNQTASQKKEFLELTNIYDRLIDLRKNIGLD